MADEYRIQVEFGDFGNSINKLFNKWQSDKAKVEGEVVKVRFGADQKDFDQISKQILAFENKPKEINLQIDTGTLYKQMDALKGYVGKNGKKIGEQFRDNITEGFQGNQVGIEDLIKRFYGQDNKRISKTSLPEVLKDLQGKAFAPVSTDNYMDIVKQAEAMEQLLFTIRELQSTEKYKGKYDNILSSLGLSETGLEASISKKYTDIGKIFSTGEFTQNFEAEIKNALEIYKKNFEAFIESLQGSLNELGKGFGGGGTGGGGGELSEAVKKQVEAVEKEIEDATQQIEEAQKKLADLRKQAKASTEKDLGGLIKEYEKNLDKPASDKTAWDEETIVAKEKEMYQLMLNKIANKEKLKKEWKEYYDDWKEQYPDMKPGEAVTDSTNQQLEAQIKQQEIALDELKRSLQELQKKRQEILDEATKGTGTGGGGTGTGEGGEGLAKEGKVTIDAEEAKKVIGEVREELDKLEDKTIKITVEGPESKSLDLLNKLQEIYGLANNSDKIEYGLRFNSQTGEASSIAKGSITRKSVNLTQAGKEMGDRADSSFHSHPNSLFAAFSVGDIEEAFKSFSKGLKYEFLQATDQIAKLDLGKLFGDLQVDAKKLTDEMSKAYAAEEEEYRNAHAEQFTFKGIFEKMSGYEDEVSKGILNSIRSMFSENNINLPTGEVEQVLIDNVLQELKTLSTSDERHYGSLITDAISDVIDAYVKSISDSGNLGKLNIDDFRDGIFDAIDNIIPESFRNSNQISGDVAEMFRQRAFSKALKATGVENPSDVFSVQSRDSWLQSMYPTDYQPEIEIKAKVKVDSKELQNVLQGAVTEPIEVEVKPVAKGGETVVASSFATDETDKLTESEEKAGSTGQQAGEDIANAAKKAEENWNELNKAINKYVDNYNKIKSGNAYLVSSHREGRDAGIPDRVNYSDVRMGRTTQKSIRTTLKNYLEAKRQSETGWKTKEQEEYMPKATEEEMKSAASVANSYLNDLVSLVKGYKDMEEAARLFGKTNSEVFELVKSKIEAATEADEAQKFQSAYSNRLKNALSEYGISPDNDQFLDLKKAAITGGFEAFATKVKELFGVEIPESAEKAREAIKSISDTEPDTSGTERQTKANREEEQSARDAAKAEEERKKAAQGENAPAGQNAETGSEATAMGGLKDAVDAVTQAVFQKTNAFLSERQIVEQIINGEISSLHDLERALFDVGSDISTLGELFESLGESLDFSTFFANLDENKDTLKAFADILKKSEEKQKKATENAKKAEEESKKKEYSMFGDELHKFTPESEGWERFLEKAKATGIELENIDSVYRQLRKDADGNILESFVVTDRQGSKKTIGANTQGIIAARDASVASINKQLQETDKIIGRLDKAKSFLDFGDIDSDFTKATDGLNKLVKAGVLAQDEVDKLKDKFKEAKKEATGRLTDEAIKENERIDQEAATESAKREAEAKAQAQKQAQEAAAQAAADAKEQQNMVEELIGSFEKLYDLEKKTGDEFDKTKIDAIKARQESLEKQIDWGAISSEDNNRYMEAEKNYKTQKQKDADAQSQAEAAQRAAEAKAQAEQVAKQAAADAATEAKEQKAMVDELIGSYEKLYDLETKSGDEFDKTKVDNLRQRKEELERRIDWGTVSSEDMEKINKAERDYNNQKAADAAAEAQKQAEEAAEAQAAAIKKQQDMIDELCDSYERMYKLEQDIAKGIDVNKNTAALDALKQRRAELSGRIDWLNMSDENNQKIANSRDDYRSKKRQDAVDANASSLVKEIRTQIAEYKAAAKEYNDLFSQQQRGVLPGSVDMTAKQDDLKALYAQLVVKQEELNAAKANGAKIDEKDENALKEALKITKERIEADVNTSQQNKRITALQSSISAMERQSSWRVGGWDKVIDETKDDLEELKNWDFSSAPMDQFEAKFSATMTRIKGEMKNFEFLPIKDTWTDSMSSKVEKWADTNKIAAKEYADELEKLRQAIKNVNSEADAADVENMFNKLDATAAREGKLGKSLGDRFKDQFSNTMTSLATYYLSFQDFVRYGREAITIVKDMDTAMTNLKKVVDDSSSAFDNFQKQSFDIAKETGSTAKAVVDAATEWGRLGYSLKDSAELSKASVVYSNVGEIDATQASKDLVSALKAFDKNAEEAMSVVDVLNEIGNNYAISSGELGTVLEKSSASLALSGDTLESVVAMGAGMNEVIQDASVTGSTLKVVGLRLRGAKTELTNMDEDTDGMVTSTSKLRAQIMALTNVKGKGGFDIMADAKNFKSTYDIIDGIASRWEDMSQIDQAALLELAAGKNRAQGLAALIGNWDTAKKAYEDAQNAENSAMKENEKFMDSLEGHITRFQNEIQRLATDAIDVDFLKGIVDFGTKAIEVIDRLGDAFGHLPTLIGAAAGIFLQKFGKGRTKMVGLHKNAPFELYGTMPLYNNRVKDAVHFGALREYRLKFLRKSDRTANLRLTDCQTAVEQANVLS